MIMGKKEVVSKMRFIDRIHGGYIQKRRINVLANHIASLIPNSGAVLDVGCGDGTLDALILQKCPELEITGLEVINRQTTHIPVSLFDGKTIERLDKSVDVIMMIDVLHHTEDPMVLLSEASRVSKKYIIIKDHLGNTKFEKKMLRFMDDVGNKRYGVSLPHNYWSSGQWDDAFLGLGLKKDKIITSLGLYPFPISAFFDRNLHFIVRLEVGTSTVQTI